MVAPSSFLAENPMALSLALLKRMLLPFCSCSSIHRWKAQDLP